MVFASGGKKLFLLTNSLWDYTDQYGWMWVSDYEWGWAPFHYGRWTFDQQYGWMWVPGRTWGPAWVSFRYGDSYVGWAPLPPEGYDDVPSYGYEPTINVAFWNFVPRQHFNDRYLTGTTAITAKTTTTTTRRRTSPTSP